MTLQEAEAAYVAADTHYHQCRAALAQAHARREAAQDAYRTAQEAHKRDQNPACKVYQCREGEPRQPTPGTPCDWVVTRSSDASLWAQYPGGGPVVRFRRKPGRLLRSYKTRNGWGTGWMLELPAGSPLIVEDS